MTTERPADRTVVTDFHTHAFPDPLAERAIRTLEAETDNVKAKLDGRLASLLESMDRAGIRRSLVCSIATRPEQFHPILKWSLQIRSERIIPLPSVHPGDPNAVARIREVAQAGLPGLKMHPYYQDFYLDDPSLFPLYGAMSDLGLFLVCHTGFDIAFPRIRRCDPARILNVVRRFPDLRFVTTHLGSWQDWDEVRRHILGRSVYMEISYSLEEMTAEAARSLILDHPPAYVLFGTDSPWQDQTRALALLRGLELGAGRETAILSGNAARLLDSPGGTGPSAGTDRSA